MNQRFTGRYVAIKCSQLPTQAMVRSVPILAQNAGGEPANCEAHPILWDLSFKNQVPEMAR
ncbi:hypothetical protein V1277_006396 [Bradyrhizobium sp. AZCC 1588]